MWQVQWDTGKNQFETPLSLTTRVSSEEEKIERFFLYPTQNIYNFILLDQIDGRVWQIQWSTEVKKLSVFIDKLRFVRNNHAVLPESKYKIKNGSYLTN